MSVIITALLFYLFYMVLVAKRFFTKVKFDDGGITVVFCKKVLEQYTWSDIDFVRRGVECRKSCYVLYDKEEKVLLTLEKRAEILDILKEHIETKK